MRRLVLLLFLFALTESAFSADFFSLFCQRIFGKAETPAEKLPESPESKTIVERNLVTLKQQFWNHFGGESIGGNAGANQAAINMAVSTQTGRIAMIANYQEYPPEVKARLLEGSMVEVSVLVDLRGQRKHQIVNIESLSSVPRRNLESALETFLKP